MLHHMPVDTNALLAFCIVDLIHSVTESTEMYVNYASVLTL